MKKAKTRRLTERELREIVADCQSPTTCDNPLCAAARTGVDLVKALKQIIASVEMPGYDMKDQDIAAFARRALGAER